MTNPTRLQRLGIADYDKAHSWQMHTADAVRAGADDVLALLEHPPVFSYGRRVRPQHLLVAPSELKRRGASLIESDRGGDITFHGPGQLVGYPIINLKRQHLGPRDYVCRLEDVMIQALAKFGLNGESIRGRPGVWLNGEKVGAIGVRVRAGVSTHGFALNVATDLSWFEAITACGLKDASVTSMEIALGYSPGLRVVEDAVIGAFATAFGCYLVEDAVILDLAPSFDKVLADRV